MKKRKCERKFKAKCLYFVYPSVVLSNTKEIIIERVEGYNIEYTRQTIKFKQLDKPLLAYREGNSFISLDDYEEIISEKFFRQAGIDKKFFDVFSGDVVNISCVDFLSKMGKLSLIDRFIYLKNPFKKGELELKDKYLDFQISLKEEYTEEEIEEILFYLSHLKKEENVKEKVYCYF